MKNFIFFLMILNLDQVYSSSDAARFTVRKELDNDLKAFCLKSPVLTRPQSATILESNTKIYKGVRFESARYEMRLKGIKGHPDCVAHREIFYIVDKKVQIPLFESGFFPPAYCESPTRLYHPPIVYEMEKIGKVKDKERKSKIAIIELVSSTLPCPDTPDERSRRFMFFDLENSNKLFLDLEADFIVPEGGENPYRIHLINSKKVFHSLMELKSGETPSYIEAIEGGFSIIRSSSSKSELATNKLESRVLLNAIYSKDKDHVYYKTDEDSGKIENADPYTFQLLGANDKSTYAKDSKRVYFYGKPIPTADSKTFVQMNERFGKDIHNVYYMESILPSADAMSFSTPYKNVWYGKDKDHVYKANKIFKLADPETFSTGDDRSCGEGCIYRSEDKNYRFGWDDQVVQKVIPVK